MRSARKEHGNIETIAKRPLLLDTDVLDVEYYFRADRNARVLCTKDEQDERNLTL